ncbi:MAG: multicopper oxidase CueO [Pseudomonadota bacterium]
MSLTRREILAATGTVAVAAPFLTIPSVRAETRPALPIPPIVSPDENGSIALTAEAGQMRFVDSGMTPTFGYSGPFLGPTLRMRRGSEVEMVVTNALPEEMTVHWHGLVIPGVVDGGPHQIIKPGGTWRPALPVDQPAATLWYHPHIYPATAELVIKGLAGLLLVDDDETDALGLPSTWGVDDIPIVIQDRRFEENGAFFHRFNLAAVTVGYVGDRVLVNGTQHPVAKTAKGWLRLRILNGSNARTYRLKASDGRTLHVIGSDGGLLEAPVSMDELTVHAGERFEVMVDARSGEAFDLVTLPVAGSPIMHLPPFHQALSLLTFEPTGAEGNGTLPDRLASLPSFPNELPPVSGRFTMDMNLDKEGMGALMKAGIKRVMAPGGPPGEVVKALTDLIVNGPTLPLETQLSANAVNGKSYELAEVPMNVPRGQPLRWVIDEGGDQMLHPVHIHGCQYRIVSLNGKPPVPHMAGWKDTVPIEDGGSAEILVTFPHAAPPEAPYMLHCHILEHEDSGMMTQFSVT